MDRLSFSLSQVSPHGSGEVHPRKGMVVGGSVFSALGVQIAAHQVRELSVNLGSVPTESHSSRHFLQCGNEAGSDFIGDI